MQEPPKLKIEYVSPSSIQPHPRNVRMHPEDNIQAIIKSLETFGQRKPLVVWRNWVVAGCGTLESIKRLKWSEVAIVRSNHLTEAQIEAFSIADNKTTDMSEFNYEMLSATLKDLEGKEIDLAVTGFQKYELEPLMQSVWTPPEPSADPIESGLKPVKFTDEQWATIQPALERLRESESEFETEKDAEALTVMAYRYMNP